MRHWVEARAGTFPSLGRQLSYSYLDDVRASSRLEDASKGSKAIKWLTGLIMIGHGLIHGLGPIAIWGIADIQGFSGTAALAVSEVTLQALARLISSFISLSKRALYTSMGWVLPKTFDQMEKHRKTATRMLASQCPISTQSIRTD